MKVKWGSIVVDGRGKIGGHVASKNASGAYFRTKVTPANPQSAAQAAARSQFGAISSGWSSLTAAQRLAWDNAVDSWARSNVFGDLTSLTGKALYQRLSNQAQAAGFSAVEDVPQRERTPSGIITAAEFDLTAGTLNLTGANTDAGVKVMVWGTEALSDGTTFVKNRLRHFDTQDADSYTGTDVFDAYEARFGTPAAGQNIHIAVKYVISTGQSSVRQSLKATITP